MRDMRGEQEEEEERGGGVAKGCKRMTRCDSAGSAGGKKKSSVITHGPKTLQAWQKQETGKRNKMLEAQQKPEDGCVREEVRRNSEPLRVKPPSLAY